MNLIKASDFHAIVASELELLYDDPEAYKQILKDRQAAEIARIKEQYPNGVPEITATELGMCSGNAR